MNRSPGGSQGVLRLAGPIIIAMAILSPAARGQCVANELTTLTATDAAIFDYAGKSVSVSGDVAVVGASKDDAGFESGAAYIFRAIAGKWEQEAKLTASDAAQQDFFGRSVAISGDAVLIGAYADDEAGASSGSAYVFRFDGRQWIEETKLTASDASPGDRFGLAVALSNDMAVIGAAFNGDGGFYSGSVYVYRFDGAAWVEEAKLTAADAAPNDLFGFSVAVSGDRIVVGTYLDDDLGNDAGAAYVYRFDGRNWNEEAKLVASDAAPFDQFGFSVAVSDDRVAVGAHLDDDAGSRSGAAYVFRFDGAEWVEEAKLAASDAAALDQFGVAVSISSDTVVIGALADDDAGPQSGGAYVYRFDGLNWIEQAKLTASDADEEDKFGQSVSVSGDTAVVGAYMNTTENGQWSGSVYVFNGLSDCNKNGVLDLCDIADGTSDDDNNNGIPDECELPTYPVGR